MQYQPVYDNYIPEYLPPLDIEHIPTYDLEPRKDEYQDPYIFDPVYGDAPLPFTFDDPYIRFEPLYDMSPEPYYGHLDLKEVEYDAGPEYISFRTLTTDQNIYLVTIKNQICMDLMIHLCNIILNQYMIYLLEQMNF